MKKRVLNGVKVLLASAVFFTSNGLMSQHNLPVSGNVSSAVIGQNAVPLGLVPETQVTAAQCGTTIEYLNTEYIAADPVSGAEQYEFRITDGAYVATATDNLQAGKVRMLQFAGYAYNTTYQMSVRAKVDGVWGDYGSACSIATTAYPHSEVQASQCGATLTALDAYIYGTSVNGATQYRFRITNGANVQIIERPVRTFQLTMLPSYNYSTTYTVEIAVQFDGLWGPYSTGCTVTTPGLGTSKVLPSQCGTTLAAVSSTIFSSNVIDATAYRYRITNNADVQTIDKATPGFKLTELASYAFSTTYSIEVAVEYNGSWKDYGPACSVSTPGIVSTQVQASQCGATLATMTTYIYANSASGATAYRFRFTEGGNVQTHTGATRAMNVTMLALHKASTTYSVEVAVLINGTWSAYGSSCSITTPAVPTQVKAAQCGTTLSKVDKVIYADPINFATRYRFRVTNGATVQTIDRTNNSFYLSQLPSFDYATAYSIEVAVEYGGIWQPYAGACTITTPAASTVSTTLDPSLCGNQVSSNSRALKAVKVLKATQYEFLVENAELGYSQSYVSNTSSFSLSQLPGILTSTDYTVKVRTMVDNVWSAYGAACTITSANANPGARPGSADGEAEVVSSEMAASFEAIAFPNPFTGEFGLQVTVPGSEMVSVTVYDMSGKVLASHTASPAEIGTLKLGEGFNAGIYQVRLIQGTETKTIKVVKQ